ncbi:MAG: glutamate-5-semialdehyde dehydrogenase [Kiritimatiellae bacterium]|nr:glutamate-5-semialdehyde dehydrogenase [Kiritimatiellia bacterium]
MQSIHDLVQSMGRDAKAAAAVLRRIDTAGKNAALESMARALEEDREKIFAANAADVAEAEKAGIPPAMIDRLTLTEARFSSMVDGVRHVATLPDPVGEVIWERSRPSGISIRKIREPLGVVAVVFESRPNVFIDTAALCLKAGNAIILRGGKEALGSNAALAAAAAKALERAGLPPKAVQFVQVRDHEAVAELVRATGLVDVAIPRGGERLIRAMCEAALVPVLKHYKGVCHIYVDDKADLAMALSILDNAKVQRPSACNAAECLLVHEKLAPLFLPMVKAWAKDKGVALHDDGAGVEYLSLDLNVAMVAGYREAIDYINANSSGHSDCIVTEDKARAAEFLRDVDSACVYHNASTRFTDGAEFGMGAEIGISTDKLHARGPMGLEELTTYKYAVTGDGALRS